MNFSFFFLFSQLPSLFALSHSVPLFVGKVSRCTQSRQEDSVTPTPQHSRSTLQCPGEFQAQGLPPRPWSTSGKFSMLLPGHPHPGLLIPCESNGIRPIEHYTFFLRKCWKIILNFPGRWWWNFRVKLLSQSIERYLLREFKKAGRSSRNIQSLLQRCFSVALYWIRKGRVEAVLSSYKEEFEERWWVFPKLRLLSVGKKWHPSKVSPFSRNIRWVTYGILRFLAARLNKRLKKNGEIVFNIYSTQ